MKMYELRVKVTVWENPVKERTRRAGRWTEGSKGLERQIRGVKNRYQKEDIRQERKGGEVCE